MSSLPVILCVDDETTVLRSLREQLLRGLEGECSIEVAESGEDALEAYDELVEDGSELAVVISDHIMPGIKGDELLRLLHERAPDARKIMLTGQASADAVGNAVNRANLYRYLEKPWRADDLILTARGALEAWRSDRARLEQQATLREMVEVSLALTANLAAADRYGQLVGSAQRVLRADRVALFRRDEDRLRPMAASHEGLTALALEEYPDLEGDLRATRPVRRTGGAVLGAAHGALTWSGEDRALVTAPLRVGDEVAGLLVVGWDAPDGPRTVRDDRITGFAALAAAAIRTTELVDAIEGRSEQRRRVAVELQREATARRARALLGESDAVRALRDRIERLGPSEAPVLVVGPTGSGLEATARALHAASARSEGPFLTVDCALVEDEAELSGPQGKLALAAGGSLYLAGVGTLARPLQERLRAHVERGDAAGARLIASSTRELDARHFDVPLLRVLTAQRLYVPALRDRPEDVPALAQHMAAAHARRLGRPPPTLSEPLLARLRNHTWPGNVDELGNVIERALLASTGDVLELDDNLLDTGTKVGSYRLTERIGAGGMGEVWRARHEHLARPAAVKLIQGAVGMQTPEATARFRREASAIAALRSPHTVELYDFGVNQEGECFFVMELLEGMDLQSLVDQHGPLPPSRAVHLVSQACLSLGEAHAAGLIHRDIKPANLFVGQLGLEPDFVKVLDFGMVSAGEGDVQLTSAGQIHGTPSYMAPEHGAEGVALDHRVDLYALGCVLHFLLTGRTVFEATLPVRVILAHMHEAPEPPSRHAPYAVPEELDALVSRLLAKHPGDRPSSAQALRASLAALPLAAWTDDEARDWWAARDGGAVQPAPKPESVHPSGVEATLVARPTARESDE
ncbi:MAG: protein kinase [Sandaracinaceae bacterium]|nr:protein kinase [Sandaracinaceae bacterium]